MTQRPATTSSLPAAANGSPCANPSWRPLPWPSVTVSFGRYVYERNGEPVPLDETFNVDGRRATSVRVQPGGARLETDAYLDDYGLATEFTLRWTHSGDGHIPERTVRYSISGNTLTFAVDGETTERTVAENAVLFPLLRVFQGAAILAVADSSDKGRQVIIPDLHALTEPGRLLHPTIETRVARLLSSNDSRIGTYRYEGSVYDAHARFMIDRDTKQMTEYTFPQSEGVLFTVRRRALDAELSKDAFGRFQGRLHAHFLFCIATRAALPLIADFSIAMEPPLVLLSSSSSRWCSWARVRNEVCSDAPPLTERQSRRTASSVNPRALR